MVVRIPLGKAGKVVKVVRAVRAVTGVRIQQGDEGEETGRCRTMRMRRVKGPLLVGRAVGDGECTVEMTSLGEVAMRWCCGEEVVSRWLTNCLK